MSGLLSHNSRASGVRLGAISGVTNWFPALDDTLEALVAFSFLLTIGSRGKVRRIGWFVTGALVVLLVLVVFGPKATG